MTQVQRGVTLGKNKNRALQTVSVNETNHNKEVFS